MSFFFQLFFKKRSQILKILQTRKKQNSFIPKPYLSTCFTHFLFENTCFTHFLLKNTCFTHLLFKNTCFTHLLFKNTCFTYFRSNSSLKKTAQSFVKNSVLKIFQVQVSTWKTNCLRNKKNRVSKNLHHNIRFFRGGVARQLATQPPVARQLGKKTAVTRVTAVFFKVLRFPKGLPKHYLANSVGGVYAKRLRFFCEFSKLNITIGVRSTKDERKTTKQLFSMALARLVIQKLSQQQNNENFCVIGTSSWSTEQVNKRPGPLQTSLTPSTNCESSTVVKQYYSKKHLLHSGETTQHKKLLLHSGETLQPENVRIKFHQRGPSTVVKLYLHWNSEPSILQKSSQTLSTLVLK